MKHFIQTLKITLTVLCFAIIPIGLQAEPPNTGIQGQAALYISYGTPVEVEPGFWVSVGDVMMPVSTSFVVLSAQSGHEVGRFTADSDVGFQIALTPGKYLIVPEPLLVSSFPAPEAIEIPALEVTVRPQQFTHALILYYQNGPLSLSP